MYVDETQKTLLFANALRACAIFSHANAMAVRVAVALCRSGDLNALVQTLTGLSQQLFDDLAGNFPQTITVLRG